MDVLDKASHEAADTGSSSTQLVSPSTEKATILNQLNENPADTGELLGSNVAI